MAYFLSKIVSLLIRNRDGRGSRLPSSDILALIMTSILLISNLLGPPPQEIAEDYKRSLEDRTVKLRYEINNLIPIVKKNTEHAMAIARVLENHIKNASRAQHSMSGEVTSTTYYFVWLILDLKEKRTDRPIGTPRSKRPCVCMED